MKKYYILLLLVGLILTALALAGCGTPGPTEAENEREAKEMDKIMETASPEDFNPDKMADLLE